MTRRFDDPIVVGDCLDTLRGMPDASVDAVVTDPPYGLGKEPDPREVLAAWLDGAAYQPGGAGFMGRAWDAFVPSPVVWSECHRVLKPGGHLLAFAGSRTYDWIVMGVRLAGFEVRDQLLWLYGSGFPKSLNVSKAIDKRGGRPDLSAKIGVALKSARESRGLTVSECDLKYCGGTTNWTWFEGRPAGQRIPSASTFDLISKDWPEVQHLAEAVSEASRETVGQRTTGIGTGRGIACVISDGDRDITAPATEAARQWDGWGTALKPAHEPIVLARKPLSGTVAHNVTTHGTGAINVDGCRVGDAGGVGVVVAQGGLQAEGWGTRKPVFDGTVRGRFPANVMHDGSPEVLAGFPGEESRFFYCAKASRAERERGLTHREPETVGDGRETPIDNAYQRGKTQRRNVHPTVKPVAVMRWLVRLVTPPGGVVLDPFTGSGTTGIACALEGFRFIGCELSHEYADLARGRIAHARANPRQWEPDADPLDEPNEDQLDMFQ